MITEAMYVVGMILLVVAILSVIVMAGGFLLTFVLCLLDNTRTKAAQSPSK